MNKSTIQYIFILGNNPELSKAEIVTILPKAKIVSENDTFLMLEHKKLDCQAILNQLGGTIKIGEIIGDKLDVGLVVQAVMENKSEGSPHENKSLLNEKLLRQSRNIPQGKVKFGFSYYGVKSGRRFGMEVKKELRGAGISSRVVVSKAKALSSVVVTKNKVLDFLVLPGLVGLTMAVQDFEKYSELDYGRPASDSKSGMLPPKLAKMMINLAHVDQKATLLDPFCGSGTVLTEAAALGYQNLTGCDSSARATGDTKTNLEWMNGKFPDLSFDSQVFTLEVKKLISRVKPESVSAIVTEPSLGPALRGTPSEKEVIKIRSELEKLYLDSFEQFKKVLKSGSRVVMIWPQWHLGSQVVDIGLAKQVTDIGFKRLDNDNLIYSRFGQKIWRKITIWEK